MDYFHLEEGHPLVQKYCVCRSRQVYREYSWAKVFRKGYWRWCFEFYTVWNAIPWKPWSWVEAQNLLKYLWTNSVTGLSIPWPNTAEWIPDDGKRLLLNKFHWVVINGWKQIHIVAADLKACCDWETFYLWVMIITCSLNYSSRNINGWGKYISQMQSWETI